MSYYLNIYVVSHEEISDLLQEDPSVVRSKLAEALGESEERFLGKLLIKNYERDPDTWESEDANGLIMSLERLCDFAANEKSTIDFYLDEDRLPELWSFSFNDWDEVNDFELPVSPQGTPAVIYRDNRSLIEYLERFKSMVAGGDFDESCISADSLKDLINIVESSVRNNDGLFIFCCQ